MNLHAIAGAVTGFVNPLISMTWLQSTGYSTAPDGTQTPSYATAVTIWAQVQPLAMQEIAHLSGLNIQGTLRAVYMTGDAAAIVRAQKQGGDLFQFVDPIGGNTALTWLAVAVLETWPEWSKVVVQLQVS